MTAVEWLVDQMRQRKEQGLTLSFYDLEMFASYAKEMEHEQIKDAYDSGIWDVGCKAPNFDEYYKRTFKSE